MFFRAFAEEVEKTAKALPWIVGGAATGAAGTYALKERSRRKRLQESTKKMRKSFRDIVQESQKDVSDFE